MNELTTVPKLTVPVPTEEPVPSVGQMLKAAIDRGITQESVAAVEKLCGLYERMQARDSEKAFAKAFNALQAEMPKVKAIKPVPNRDGSIRYHFAPFEDIMAEVKPLLEKHGFTVRFSNRYDADRIIAVCTLQHIEGHKESNEFSARVGSGPPGASSSQADGAAATYAKRFALTNALNIVVEQLDDDARLQGDYITEEQANSLRKRVNDLQIDSAKFFAYAGKADSFDCIQSCMWTILDDYLNKAAKRKEKPA